ncbi:type II toxin-antitoxin system RelE/ParE family toxin [Methylobacterium sp. JK268]
MFKIRETNSFSDWIAGLRDREARSRINIRIRRLTLGNLGKVEPVGEGVSELKIDYGPGYRVYFMQRGKDIILLLCGGDKSTQSVDIARAKELAAKERLQ